MTSLKTKLQVLLNKFSRENDSNTPDFILAEYLMNCLEAYELAVNRRDDWYELPQNLTDKFAGQKR